MITFYPGPSKVYSQVEQFLAEAYQSGILSANHRSEAFMEMLKTTIDNLKYKLNVPSDYEVYFVSSATECWEMISQSLVTNSSFHIYNGAFGAKWLEYAQKLRPASQGVSFGLNAVPTAGLLPEKKDQEVICITHNETSNGTALPLSFIRELRQATNSVIAVDATSSMAGVGLPWPDADVWYASVQKCFGLPPGLGVMIVSPRAVSRALDVKETSHYNSLLFTRSNFLKFQTPYTPNTLAIYLLGRVMEQVKPLPHIAPEIATRASGLYGFLEDRGYHPLVSTGEVRSDTVVAVQMESVGLARMKALARSQDIVLGNGYGEWKDNTFRIANFPAITREELSILKEFLTNAVSVA
jgi:phosphoserine aminotransferase